MKPITHQLQTKYRYIHFLLFEERIALFSDNIYCRNNSNYEYLLDIVYNNNEILDPDNNIIIQRFNDIRFYEFREYVLCMQYIMTRLFNQFCCYQRKIIKRFEKIKITVKRSSYTSILCKYFCYDISKLIAEFIV